LLWKRAPLAAQNNEKQMKNWGNWGKQLKKQHFAQIVHFLPVFTAFIISLSSLNQALIINA
jgi:hypothetical protein